MTPSTDLSHSHPAEVAGHESAGVDSDVRWNKVSLEEKEQFNYTPQGNGAAHHNVNRRKIREHVYV